MELRKFENDIFGIVSDRAENVGEGLEAQVIKVENEIMMKCFFLSVIWYNLFLLIDLDGENFLLSATANHSTVFP